jgi:DNA-directed RNA polymerase subunit RPC12/RpoP
MLGLVGFVAAVLMAGCGKDPTMAVLETDAHGYTCEKCGAKFYTSAKEFMGAKCPKCGEYTLADVVGYKCSADQHITLRPKVSGPAGAAVCEQCGARLKDAMVSPHEKDLKAWGAEKTLAQK